MNRKVSILAALLVTASASFASAEPAPSPDTLLLFEGAMFDSGSSSNFKPAIRQYIDEYYELGACTDVNDYAECDYLRFGLAVHGGPMCDDSDPITWMYTPAEAIAAGSGGDAVKDRLQNLHNENTYCQDTDFRNHDTGVEAAWQKTFSDTNDPSDSELDDYWTRPHLNLWGIKNFPQSADGDADDRMLKTLENVCKMYHGETGDGDNDLPSMPTWVIAERTSDEDEVLFGGLVAAAGGTGECEYRTGMTWNTIDVCDDIVGGGVSEMQLRNDITGGNPKYRCNEGALSFQTGNMNYDDASGNQGLNVIQCHLIAESFNNNCSSTNGIDTDLLGIFRCVRQLPRGVAADDAIVQYCPDECAIDNDCEDDETCVDANFPERGVCVEDDCDSDDDCDTDETCVLRDGTPTTGDCVEDPADATTIRDNCILLTEADGIEFIDENKTLFVITRGEGDEGDSCSDNADCKGVCSDGECLGDTCEPGGVDISECNQGEYCDTGQEGRCASGTIDCSTGVPVCVPDFEGFPEICNGLDDDCDGEVDNLKDSWAKSSFNGYSLPDEHAGLACNELDVCVCPGGATGTHTGGDFDAYLDNWTDVCQCGEGLAPDGIPAPDSDAMRDTESACATVADNSIPVSFLGLMVLGIVGLVRRRRE